MEIIKLLYSTTLILFTSLLLFKSTAYSAPFPATTNLENSEKSAAIKQTVSDEKINEKINALYQTIEMGMTLEEVQIILGSPGISMQAIRRPDGDIITDHTWDFENGDTIIVRIGADGVVQKNVCCPRPL
ncbi:MAG: hypothetical protein RIM23_00445 [Coleofasciculus sp. G3-WIS-01]|uniref:hypothetical protein n=1 Tax=Coleofasciculus sp. G3-WIS-01 TaxID=3069528 RepID=UPI0032F4A6C2